MDSFELRNIINEIMDKKNLDLSGIAEKSKANRSYLSKVINSKESVQVGPKLAGKIARAFPEHWPGNNTNNNPPKGHYFTADQLFHMYMKAMERQDEIMESQLTLLKSIEGKMAQESTQAKIESSLSELSERGRTIQAQVQAIHQWDAEILASGDAVKADAALSYIRALVAGNREKLSERNIGADRGKLDKRVP